MQSKVLGKSCRTTGMNPEDAVSKANKAKVTKVDPFKTKKTKTALPKEQEPLQPPAHISEAIDKFRECQEQARHFEAEATVFKDSILNYCQEVFSENVVNGRVNPFKVMGVEGMIHYVIQDASSGLTDEDFDEIAEKWGEEAASELVVKDYASIKFDPKILAANYDLVVKCLQALPEKVLSQLFRPMLLKSAPGAMEKISKIAKSSEEVRELMNAIKIKNYIK